MRGKNLARVALLALASAGSVTAAKADTKEIFSLDGGGFPTLDATFLVDSSDVISKFITGSFGTETITGVSSAAEGLYTPDNKFFSAPDYVDSSGIAFILSDGSIEQIVNVGAEGTPSIAEINFPNPSDPLTFTVTVPEPATVALVGVMAAGLGLMRWRRA